MVTMKHFFTFLFTLLLLSGSALAVELISVYNLPIRATDKNATQARSIAQKQGATDAVFQAIKKIALNPDTIVKEKINNIDTRYIYATDILSEKVTSNRYVATVDMHLYAYKVRELAQRLNIPISYEAIKTTIVIPFWQDDIDKWSVTFTPAIQTTLSQQAKSYPKIIMPQQGDAVFNDLKKLTFMPLLDNPIIKKITTRYINADIRYIAFQNQDTGIHITVFAPDNNGLKTISEIDQTINNSDATTAFGDGFKQAVESLSNPTTNTTDNITDASPQKITLNINISDIGNRFRLIDKLKLQQNVSGITISAITSQSTVVDVKVTGDSSVLQEFLTESGYKIAVKSPELWDITGSYTN